MSMLPASMDDDLEGGAEEAMKKMEGKQVRASYVGPTHQNTTYDRLCGASSADRRGRLQVPRAASQACRVACLPSPLPFFAGIFRRPGVLSVPPHFSCEK